MIKKKKLAFTLVEMIVVVFIIAVIGSVIVVSTSGSKKREEDARKISEIFQLQIALENYKRSEGSYPESIELGQALIGSSTGIVFLSKIPPAPSGEPCGSQYIYSYSTSTKEYSFSFCLLNGLEDYPPGKYNLTPRGIEGEQ